MKSNLEIKARVSDPDALHRRVAEIADSGPELLVQEDVFFEVPRGRLKLRHFANGTAELISYRREDATGPTRSRYVKSPCVDPDSMRQALSEALGVRGVVRKRRRLYRQEGVRIHLDAVEGLGSFLEIEVVTAAGEASAQQIAARLMRRLGVHETDLVGEAYIDLLLAAESARS